VTSSWFFLSTLNLCEVKKTGLATLYDGLGAILRPRIIPDCWPSRIVGRIVYQPANSCHKTSDNQVGTLHSLFNYTCSTLPQNSDNDSRTSSTFKACQTERLLRTMNTECVCRGTLYTPTCLIYYKIICVIHQDSTFINVCERQDENSPPLIRAVHPAKLIAFHGTTCCLKVSDISI